MKYLLPVIMIFAVAAACNKSKSKRKSTTQRADRQSGVFQPGQSNTSSYVYTSTFTNTSTVQGGVYQGGGFHQGGFGGGGFTSVCNQNPSPACRKAEQNYQEELMIVESKHRERMADARNPRDAQKAQEKYVDDRRDAQRDLQKDLEKAAKLDRKLQERLSQARDQAEAEEARRKYLEDVRKL